ncbi:hypothetical protein [Cohnella hongkongensis]|uniref:Heparin-sulfate lyase N-terminal domain-containing protein n=1 Tax=Cohnella hongkongensis TaxID=178337 RepID=A0ABV9FCE6_9BACL
MIRINVDPLRIEWKEELGFAHERQIVTIPVASAGLPETGWLVAAKDGSAGGQPVFYQAAKDGSGIYLELEAAPYERLVLTPAPEGIAPSPGWRNSVRTDGCRAWLSNGRMELEVPLGTRKADGAAEGADAGIGPPGPVCRMRAPGGSWRGRSYLDTRRPAERWEGTVLESGPLRVVYAYRADWNGGWYEAVLTMDAGQRHVRLEESFDTEPGAQLIWDFSGEDLPVEAWLLDSTAACTAVPLHNRFDRRLARLASWNQYSQLHDLSDGYAVGFAQGEETVGFVALNGGDWRGNRLNHVELWLRRWERDDPRTRKETPWDAKADWTGHPERIAARGESVNVPHVNVESWIVRGQRRSALVVADRQFVTEGGLRRLQTRHGVVSLETIMAMELSEKTAAEAADEAVAPKAASGETGRASGSAGQPAGSGSNEDGPAAGTIGSRFAYPNGVLEPHFLARFSGSFGRDRIRRMSEYARDMTEGFWNGAGASHVNCVDGRMIAPCLFLFERAAAEGGMTPEERERCRARLLFLAYLYASDHYYPGLSTMLPIGDESAVEPTMAGMANQNFYTDIINVFATAAQIFPNHPSALAWRDKFAAMWRRQKEFHMYPDSGVWEESHTYYHHVLYTLLPLLLRRREDGAGDEFADAEFRELLGSALRQFTPRYAENGGARTMAALGDHFDEVALYREQYAEYALAVAPHDPELAGRLAWAYREMNGTRELAVPERVPPWEDEYVRGLGFMFRSRDERGRDSLLVLRSGSAWGHHHNDEGSIQLYARGHALIVDSAFSRVQGDPEKKLGHRGQSRWTLRDIEPMNYFFRFNRGWISEWDGSAEFPYATAYDPVHMFFVQANRLAYPMKRPLEHARTIVRLSPTSYLLADVCDTDLPQVIRFHAAGEHAASSAAEMSGVNAVVGECRLTIVPLSTERPEIRTDTDADTATGQFRTTEFAFHCGLRPLNVFYISADEIDWPSPRVSIQEEGEKALKGRIDHGESGWTFEFADEGPSGWRLSMAGGMKTTGRIIRLNGKDRGAP